MKRLLNTLYVFTEDMFLSLDGENVVAKQGGKEAGRYPLHTLESILSFSYSGASPALMGACADRNINMAFFTPRGKFLARTMGLTNGNVLLRKQQYRYSEDEAISLNIARNFILGKVFNSRWVLERAIRDHALAINANQVRTASVQLQESIKAIKVCTNLDSLRGIEGDAASVYFGVLNELILREKDSFQFASRNRRPPTDPVNAMLSFFYTVLASNCASALEGVGLDSYVGLMHADRPGRQSLALDLMEELRPIMVDRFVLTCINTKVVKPEYFETRKSGEVRFTEEGKKALLAAWQKKKMNTITHPFLKEKIPWGLIPHIQAILLARCIRGDLDGYPPLLWK